MLRYTVISDSHGPVHHHCMLRCPRSSTGKCLWGSSTSTWNPFGWDVDIVLHRLPTLTLQTPRSVGTCASYYLFPKQYSTRTNILQNCVSTGRTLRNISLPNCWCLSIGVQRDLSQTRLYAALPSHLRDMDRYEELL